VWGENPLAFRSIIPAQKTYERNAAFIRIRISRGNSSIWRNLPQYYFAHHKTHKR
jgi:hypothetical protein